MLYILLCHSRDVACGRNAATETVQQELLFVGQEAGKLMAMRDIVKKVRTYVRVCVHTYSTWSSTYICLCTYSTLSNTYICLCTYSTLSSSTYVCVHTVL